MATSTIDIRSIIASLSGIPMTLESGVNFPINSLSPMESTNYLMENSPFFIALSACGGIKLTTRANGAGNWLISTSTIIEAKSFDNGCCCFMTENGHKYQFTTWPSLHKAHNPSKQMKRPIAPIVKQYSCFDELPFNEKNYFEYYMERYVYRSQSSEERYTFGQFRAKKDDYGFMNGNFCHVSSSKNKINSLLNHDGENMVGLVVQTPKGYKLCDYVFECDNPDEYLKIVSSLKQSAKQYYLREVNERLHQEAEYEHECAMIRYNKQMDIQYKLGFHAVDIIYERDQRAYCDNQSTMVFEFSRSISRKEFSAFLKEMGEEEIAQGAWYSPYTIITGKGDKWTYTYVSPSH